MNDPKPLTQRLLFECDGPHWNTLPSEPQQQLLDVLSQLLLDAVQRWANDSITTEITNEDDDVS